MVACVLIMTVVCHTTDNGLGVEDSRTVRNIIYKEKLIVQTAAPVGGAQIVNIPKQLVDLYKRKPASVLALLVRIVDGANPKESATAAAYALALVQGGGGGVAVALTFYSWGDKYDEFDDDWGMTHREHWLEKIRSAKEAKEKIENTKKK